MKHLLLTTIAAVVLVGTVFADPIHDAAYNGDLVGVQAELDKGVDVDVKGGFANGTPLNNAAANGHKVIVELLIAKGVNENAIDNGGDTPLDKASLCIRRLGIVTRKSPNC
ncbi:ankyrin repeat domain-containing protein [Verrucomicrobia bacterium]|nr:ankyrin repeat domain-containing protein [Verrucomicrobiota bacterium]